MPYSIGGCFSEILNFDKSFWKLHITQIQPYFRNPYIGSQISNRRILHLNNDSIGLLSRFDHLNPLQAHVTSLSFYFMGLASSKNQSPTEQPNLQHARYGQKKGEAPRSPIGPVFPTVHRHGGKFADSYGIVCIFACLVLSIPIGGYGLFLACDLRNRVGWLLVAVSLVVGFLACMSGAIGCLPWNWRTCLHDGQEHSQKQEFRHQAAFDQNIGSIPSSRVS